MTHDAISKTAREQLDDEYESSTPAAGRWRERAEIRRPGSNQPAPSSEKPPPPPNPPPAEPWPERGFIRWAFWLLVAGALATLIACLT